MNRLDIMQESGYINAVKETLIYVDSVIKNKILRSLDEFKTNGQSICDEYSKKNISIISIQKRPTLESEMPRVLQCEQLFLNISKNINIHLERLKTPNIDNVCNASTCLSDAMSKVCNISAYSSGIVRDFLMNGQNKIDDNVINSIGYQYEKVRDAENRIFDATNNTLEKYALDNINPQDLKGQASATENGSNTNEKLQILKTKVETLNNRFKGIYKQKGFSGLISDPNFLRTSAIVSGGILSLYVGYKFGVAGLKKIKIWWKNLWKKN